jgi:hypothetical protein
MTVYGVKVKFPHSGQVSRSQVVTAMKKDLGCKNVEALKAAIDNNNYNFFRMEDVNYSIYGFFGYNPELD